MLERRTSLACRTAVILLGIEVYYKTEKPKLKPETEGEFLKLSGAVKPVSAAAECHPTCRDSLEAAREKFVYEPSPPLP